MNILAHTSHVGTTGYNAQSQGFFRKLSEKTNLKIRNFTIGKNWKGHPCQDGNPHGSDVNDLDKKLLHQQTLWNAHNQREDFPIYDYDSSFIADVNIILNTVDHYYFYDSYNGYKIAYNLWENSLYPNEFFEKLKEFDQVWVASKWQKSMLIEQGFFSEKIKIVPLGVDSNIYKPQNIKYDDNKFRFIIFGAWCDRKSTKEIIQCFVDLFKNNKKVELILSVNNQYYEDGCSSTFERLKKYNLLCDNIKILNFPDSETYVKYLQKGHVFLSCARGEGWNIPLMEAMACGTPSIYSNYGGQLEFAQNRGIPVKIKNLVLAQNFEKNKNQNSPGYWCEPDFDDLKKQMLEVYNNYDFYKDKALKESCEIKEIYTWENAVNIALQHLNEFKKNPLRILTSCSFVGTGGFNAVCQNLLPELNQLCDVKVRNYTIGESWKGYHSKPHEKDIKQEYEKILHLQTLYDSDGSRKDYPIYNYTANFKPSINLIINEIDHHYFYDHYDGLKIAFTMNESTEFPQHFVNQLQKFNEVWVPSKWQKQCLIKQNFLEEKIKIVPLGVDSNTFNLKNKNLRKKFTFGIFGRWDQRKSTKVMIQCFKQLFGDNENVELILSVDNPFDIDGLKNTENRLQHFNLQSKNIKVLNFLSREDYIDCLKSIHVFLSCSKAEGWNLPLIEAMACGVPSIYSECSGQLEFAESYGIPIKIKTVEKASNYILEQYSKEIQGDYYIPDFDELKNKMLAVYNNYDFFLEKAKKESDIIINNFSWHRSASIAFKNLMDLNKKMISFIKFTEEGLGIEYKNNSIFDKKIIIKFFDEKTNHLLYQHSFTTEGYGQYFSKLNNVEKITGPIVFNVYDENENLYFSVKNEIPILALNRFNNQEYIDLHFDSIYCDESIDLSGLRFKYSKKNNTLYTYTLKNIDNIVLVVKDLKKNLNLTSVCERKSFSFLRDWEYSISPFEHSELSSDIFTGFRFIGYRNDKLVFNIEISINKNFEKNKDDLQFVFDPEVDLAIQDNFFSQSLDFYTQDFYKRVVKENMIVLDIGASCGTFVDFCLNKKVKNIIALEPSRSFDVLKATFEKFKNVTVYNKALSYQTGEMKLMTSEASTLTSFDIEKQKEADYDHHLKNLNLKTINVKTITLDDILKENNLEKIDLIKIDIEGFEYEIFKNLENSTIKKINSFIIEYHHNDGVNLKNNIINKLVDNGFIIEGYTLQYTSDNEFMQKKGFIYAYQNNINLNQINEFENNIIWIPENKNNIKYEIKYYSCYDDIIQNSSFFLKNKKIAVINHSGSLGDTLAWMPVINEFASKAKIKIDVFTPYKHLFENQYFNLNLFNYEQKNNLSGYEKIYDLVWSCENKDHMKNLQKVAADILEIDFCEKKPKLNFVPSIKNQHVKKYVCISTQSTAQFKYWNNKTGWQQVVDYLNYLNYDVICIDKFKHFGIPQKMNSIPEKCIDKTGDLPLQERMNDLYFCDFFIGLTSGLSWLAWALNKKVILISGISKENTEFFTPYRITNKNVCHACTTENDFKFDISNWMFCPKNKNFECTTEITFEMVKEKIDQIINIK